MKISELISDLKSIQKKCGDIQVMADTNWSPDNKANIVDYLYYKAYQLEENFNNPTSAKDDEIILCIRIK